MVAKKPYRMQTVRLALKTRAAYWVSRILGNGNGSGKRERELPFAILLTIKPVALKLLSHCHV